MSRGSYVICWAMALLIAAAPLPFGSVDTLPSAALQICLLCLALVWLTMRSVSGLSPLPWSDPLLLGGAALIGYGLFQMAPLPPAVLSVISPHGAQIRAGFSPEPTAWGPVSLNPYATWRSCQHIACWTLAATMVRHCAVDLKGRLVVAGGLVAGGLFQAGYGLFEFISGRQHIFAYKKQYFTDVATGTFISRNNYAGYLEMAIPVGLALAMLALGRGAHPNDGSHRDSLKRRLATITGQQGFRALALLMVAFLMAIALLMSRSRMGIIAAVASLVVGGLAVGLKGRSRRFAIASVAVAIVAGLFATQIDILPVVDRFEAIRNEFGTGYGRLAVWKEAMPMLAAYPLTGSGMGTWEMAFSPFRRESTQVRVDFAHNDYLEFGAEVGVAGLAIFFIAAAAALRRRAGDGPEGGGQVGHDEVALGAGVGLVALALHSFVDFHLSIPADALAAAVLTGLYLRRNGPAPLERRVARAGPRLRLTRLSWLACSLGFVTLLLSAASPALADLRVPSVPGVPTVGARPEQADLCPECRFEPYNAARYIEAAGRAREPLLKDVEVIVRAQAAGDLPDPKTRLYLARRIDAALALANRGLAMVPASGRGHLEAGLLLFGHFALTGLPPEASDEFGLALKEFDHALVLQPWRAATHHRVTQLLAPLWDECDDQQRSFIEKATRRAREIDPWATDLKEAAARMGV